MERIYANASKTMSLSVVRNSVVVRNGRKPVTRTFRNRYTLRKFVDGTIASAEKAGFVSVNR